MKLQTKTQFEVRLATTNEEILAAQRLRYEVFIDELGAMPSKGNNKRFIDEDVYDSNCNHLLLIDRNSTADKLGFKIVGTIRLLDSMSAKKNNGFYSSQEFNLTGIINRYQHCLEIGRTCISRDYRGGYAVHFLWSGLADYVVSKGVDIMFGVASFHGTNACSFSSALSYLSYYYSAPEYLQFNAIPENYCEMRIIPRKKLNKTKAILEIPSLIKSYIRLGAQVGNGAFIDRVFNTVDVGIIIDINNMNYKYKEFYERKILIHNK